MSKPDWIGWHFLRRDRRLGHGDGREVRVGETLTVPGPVRLCHAGTLHASRRILDALRYASGPICCRVRLGADVVEEDGKAGATLRTCLAMMDATRILQEFACDVAEAALHTEMAEGREPDPRSWAALDAKRRWIRGEVSDEEMMAAWEAAEAAARVAALDAIDAATATRAAATAAARDAAQAAATAAAMDSAEVGAAAAIEAVANVHCDALRPETDYLLDIMGIAVSEFEADLTARIMEAIEESEEERACHDA